MRTYIYIIAICTGVLFTSCKKEEQNHFERLVRNAVTQQLGSYPESTLKDIYKNFFQDVYGPGHIISDTTSADNNLRSEMASYTETKGAFTEFLGWEGNYLRVNLSLLKKGIVPYDVYFDAFVSSVNNIVPMPVSEWQQQWNIIEAVINKMNLNLPDYEADKQEITDRLNAGDYVGHHSKAYEEAYDPHYRIINRDRYSKDIFPYIQHYNRRTYGLR